MGYVFRGSKIWLCQAIKEIVLKITTPKNGREVREFLGMTGFGCLWILGFDKVAKPLYDAPKKNPGFTWTGSNQKAPDALAQPSCHPCLTGKHTARYN